MANPRRNKGDIQGQYGLSDLLGLFRDYAKGDIPDSPRQRQAMRNIAQETSLPTTLPTASVGLLEAQPQQITGPTQDMQPITQPLSTQPETINNLLTKKEEEEIAKDPVALRKFSKAGDLFASFGGFQEFSPTGPEGLDAYNKQKLAARNRGIGEMLLMLSDALGGRDIAMRALERQKAKQPAKEDKKTAAMINLEAFNKIKAEGTPEQIAIAERVLIGTRQNKSEEQMKKELIASLLRQTDPLGDPISEKEINNRLQLFDTLVGKTPTPIPNDDQLLNYQGYSVKRVE